MEFIEIQLKIQVVDMEPRKIDIRVPQYIPVSDLSQRIVRDANLQTHWPDGFRRKYFVRARGRMLQEHETLQNIGLVNGELVYLLPDPDPRKGVLERNPEYPEIKPYLGQGIPQLVMFLLQVFFFSFLWGVSLTGSQHWTVMTLPSLGVAVLCVNFARHAWGGQGFQSKIGITAIVLYLIALIPPLFAPILQSGFALGDFLPQFLPGAILGFAGVIVSWFAWWGPVEPLIQQAVQKQREDQHSLHLNNCGICQDTIQSDVDVTCPFNPNCARHFHSGCLQARQGVYQGDLRACPVCSAPVVS